MFFSNISVCSAVGSFASAARAIGAGARSAAKANAPAVRTSPATRRGPYCCRGIIMPPIPSALWHWPTRVNAPAETRLTGYRTPNALGYNQRAGRTAERLYVVPVDGRRCVKGGMVRLLQYWRTGPITDASTILSWQVVTETRGNSRPTEPAQAVYVRRTTFLTILLAAAAGRVQDFRNDRPLGRRLCDPAGRHSQAGAR